MQTTREMPFRVGGAAFFVAVVLGAAQVRAEAPDSTVRATEGGAAPAPVATRPTSAANRWLNVAYRHRANHRPKAAKKAFQRALRNGAEPQLVALELGYLAAEEG